MKNSKLYASIFILPLILSLPACSHAADSKSEAQEQRYVGQEMEKQAKISLSEARKIALKAHPGQVTDQELEAEEGGSGLRYSFDIKTEAGTQEVGIDAANGKVLENALEGPNPD